MSVLKSQTYIAANGSSWGNGQVIRKFTALVLVAFAAFALDAGAPDVNAEPKSSKLDKSFGNNGMLRIPAPSVRSSELTDCFDDSKGNLWALTKLSVKRGGSIDQLTKLTPAGRVARGFGRSGRVRITGIEAAHKLQDGGFLLLRTQPTKHGREYVVARLTSSGRVQKRFASNGLLRTGVYFNRSRDVVLSALDGGKFALVLNTRTRSATKPTQLRFFDPSGRQNPQLNSSALARPGSYVDAIHDGPAGGFLADSAAITNGIIGGSELIAYTAAGAINNEWGNQGKAAGEPPEALMKAARRYADWSSSSVLGLNFSRVVKFLPGGKILAEGTLRQADSAEYELVSFVYRLDARGSWDSTFGASGGRLLWFESESDADGQYGGEDRSLTAGHKNEMYAIENSWTEAPSASLTVTKFDSNGRSAVKLVRGALITRAELRSVVPSSNRKRVYLCADSGKHSYVAALRSR